jgi:hypothetical protein
MPRFGGPATVFPCLALIDAKMRPQGTDRPGPARPNYAGLPRTLDSDAAISSIEKGLASTWSAPMARAIFR